MGEVVYEVRRLSRTIEGLDLLINGGYSGAPLKVVNFNTSHFSTPRSPVGQKKKIICWDGTFFFQNSLVQPFRFCGSLFAFVQLSRALIQDGGVHGNDIISLRRSSSQSYCSDGMGFFGQLCNLNSEFKYPLSAH